MTSKEIYNKIIENKLYNFGAKNPQAVVNSQIRRRCFGLDFPTAYPTKIFHIVGQKGKKNKFAIYNEANDSTSSESIPRTGSATEELPEERIGKALTEHLSSIKQQILENILTNSSSFFEHLVLELLLKMGYGYDEHAGVVTGRPHDGGIDGIISEDKLGLDLIYIQAKRYSPSHTVTPSELQAFIGAMGPIQKGVFITTSRFTLPAQKFMNTQQQKHIKLIDGKLLADLLIRYEVGVLPVQAIKIYKIDTDYFNN